jgi:GNAT superfamily N-acetyltransferase
MAIEYRTMELSDVERIADILAGTWHENATGEAAHLYGLIDFATYALRHTYSQVAVMDGQVEGVILARAGMPNEAAAKPWQNIIDVAYEHADEIDKEGADELRDFLTVEYAADDELLEESGCNPDYELVVFIVSPETRGHGVGTKLMAGAMQYLQSQGADKGYLFTDTTCTWEYYEHRGMRRAAERTYDPETSILPERMFVYEFDTAK